MKAHKDKLKALNAFPKSWRHTTEGTFTRLALANLPISRQEELGWYEVQEVVPTFDPATHRLVKGSLIFTGTSITRTDTVEAIPQVELDAQAFSLAKSQRTVGVQEITVVTSSGKSFDGDEISQSRMSRAITASEPLDTTPWRLQDNSVVTVSREELKEALRLSLGAQSALWFI